MKRGFYWLFCWFGVAVLGAGGFGFIATFALGELSPKVSATGHFLGCGLGLLSLGLAFWGARSILRTRLTLDAQNLVWRTAFGEKNIQLSEISGCIRTSHGGLILFARDETTVLATVYVDHFNTDGRWVTFRYGLTDLREKRAAQARNDAGRNPHLGSTTKERLETYDRLQARGWKLGALGVFLCLWAFVYPKPYYVVLVGLVCFVPACLLMAVLAPRGAKDVYLLGPLFPSLALAFRGLDVELVSGVELLPLLVVSVVLSIALLTSDFGGMTHAFGNYRWIAVLFLSAVLIPYFSGAILVLNHAMDNSSAQSSQVVVRNKRLVVDAKHGDKHYLTVSSWGPHPGPNEVPVSARWYAAAEPGASICIDVHPGALGLEWWVPSYACKSGR